MRKISAWLVLFHSVLAFSNPAVLNVGNASEPRDLDPQLCSGANETKLALNLFEGLVSKDPKDLKIIPGVSDHWEISKNGFNYTFHLRKDAFWTNGEKVTAQDFVFSWIRLLTATTAAEFSSFGFHFKNGKAFYEGKIKQISELGFKAIDESHLEVTLENPSPYFLALLAHPALFPVPKGAIEKNGSKWSRPEYIVSNGPFILSKWKSNEVIELKKNSKYWDLKNVRPDQVNVRFVTKADTEEKMFRAGGLDVTAQVPIEKIPYWEKEKTGVLQKHPYLGVYYYWLNVARPPLNNPLVRKALNLAINRESITHKVTLVKQIEAQFFTPPGTGGFYPKPILPKDGSAIIRAQELLARAGYPGGKGFPKLELLYNTDEGHKKIAESVQQMWKENLGLEVVLVNQEWKVLLDTQNLKNFTILRGGWIADYNDPNSFLEIFTTGNSNNYVSWSDSGYDEKLHDAAKERNMKRRNSLFQAAEKILLDQLPIVPIFIFTRVYLKKANLQGWFPNIEDYRTYKGVYLN
jgi:oligopeptide transport system substrate-binding protein